MCSGKRPEVFSFLEGVNPDTVSLTEIEENVYDMVYSQSSGSFYVVYGYSLSGFKWEEIRKTFSKQFEISIESTANSVMWSITLAPRDTTGCDQIYISVGSQDETKNVYRVGGRELEERVLLADTSYIDDECPWWILASNPDRHILLIHPTLTPFIYIHVKEEKRGKVDLNQLNITIHTRSPRIELFGQLLILGEWRESQVSMCELIVTNSDAFMESGSQRKPMESYDGSFAALSNVLGDEYEQLHLFTARYDKGKKRTHISEYKLNLSVSGSGIKQLPKQPIHTLRVEGNFYPHCLVNVNSYSSVLIGSNDVFGFGKLIAVELTKQNVAHHIQ